MSSDVIRVALLARAGTARDRLRDVIGTAGAECVLEGDPAELSPSALAECAPKVILVALDPQTEDALEAFDEVLADPQLEVIYEEASLASSREGWDMARWQRHLVAKMQSHGDVLPPGTEQEDAEQVALDTVAVIDWNPVAMADVADISASPEIDSAPAPEPEVSAAQPAEHINPFDPVFAETSHDHSFEIPAFDSTDIADSVEITLESESIAPDAEWPTLEDAGFVMDTALSNGDIPMDAFQVATDADPEVILEAAATFESAPGIFGELSLDDGTESAAVGDVDDTSEAKNRFARDISELEERISGLSLVDDSPRKEHEGVRGAVLVVAGLGGPDAVRQLVAALPGDFPRPILIQQRLDGGRHDKLVAQMQRATELPVRLAEDGQYAHAGIIYIMPAELGVDVSSTGIRFNPDSPLVESLPADDSAILLLSGSDQALVEVTLKHGSAGAFIAGQSADGCYDASASNELATRGGDTGSPAELAKRLADRWPA